MIVRQAMSKRILGVGIILGGLIVLSIALIIGIGFPKFVYETNLKAVCIQDASHPRYEVWVNETFMTNINRIYYWHIVNSDDFLYSGAVPQVRQRGPYVYREVIHKKIDVRFLGTTTEFRVWRQQQFDYLLTSAECGPHCTEHDRLTVLNVHHLKAVTSSGDEWRLSSLYLPAVVRSTLRRLIPITGSVSASISLLAEDNCDVVDRWRAELEYPDGFRCLGFGAWLANNDTDDKAYVLSQLSGRSLNVSVVTAIYAELAGCPDLLDDHSCLYVDHNSTLSPTPTSNFTRVLFDISSGNVSVEDKNSTGVITATLCRNADVSHCFEEDSSAAYMRAVSAYVAEHLAAYAFFHAVSNPGNDVVTTLPQRVLALGDDLRGSAILQHDVSAESTSNNSQLITVYNCYDAILAVSNGHWKSYASLRRSSRKQFPAADRLSRIISRSLRHEIAPTTHLQACAFYELAPDAEYRIFLPDFWRTVDYRVETTPQVNVAGTTLSRLVFNSNACYAGNMEVDGQFVWEDGLQEMTGTNGFISTVSLPHFLYASSALQRQFNVSPSIAVHLPFRDFEPMTGSMWHDATRYQLNVAIDKRLSGRIWRPRQLSLAYVGQPIPVYWVEKSSAINTAGIDDFYSRVGEYMSTSCGGLVGLTILDAD